MIEGEVRRPDLHSHCHGNTREEATLSGTITQTVGEPYSTTGEDVKFVPFEGNQKPGSVDDDRIHRPDEFQMLVPESVRRRLDKKLYEQIQKFQLSNNAAVADGSAGIHPNTSDSC